MPVRRLLMALPHHIHPLDHLSESGKTLAIGVSATPKVELWLIADANEKLRGRE